MRNIVYVIFAFLLFFCGCGETTENNDDPIITSGSCNILGIKYQPEIDSLDLALKDMTELPDCIGNLVGLKYLNLGFNKFTSVPESIGNLSNLIALNLNDNSISNIPDSFGELSSLKSLSLSHNSLTSLPESFKNLDGNLKVMDLENNNFSEDEKQKIISWLPYTNIYW